MDRLMNKNTIKGRRGKASWHNTAKPQVQAVEVNGAIVSRSNAFLPGEIPRRKCRGKSAEAIVVANEPGVGKYPHKHETGSLDAMKGRTDEESLDPVEGGQPDKASWPGRASSRQSMVEGTGSPRTERHLDQTTLRGSGSV
jgi:hypothetical protein